jgi:hypothetical protein
MRVVWSTLLATGLLLIAMNVFEKRVQGPTFAPGVTASDLEDGTGFPPPDPTPPPPPK